MYNLRPLIPHCITYEMSNFVRAKQHHLSDIYYIKRFENTQNNINSMTPRIISKDLQKKQPTIFPIIHHPSDPSATSPFAPDVFHPPRYPQGGI